jgi:hypothetical protein
MCKRNAENKNNGSLPFKFWNKKPWNGTFIRQMTKAHELIKKYGEIALVKAIHSPEFQKIFSLNHPLVPTIIEKYKAIIESQVNSNQEIVVEETVVPRKKSFSKKQNILHRLRNIQKNGET